MRVLPQNLGQRLALTFMAVFFTAIFGLSACASNPFKAAQTPGQKAYALYGTFVVFEQEGARLVAAPTTLPAVVQGIQKADAIAYPVATDLHHAIQVYLQVQADLKAGLTTNDKLVIATADLADWVTRAQPIITDLITAIGAH